MLRAMIKVLTGRSVGMRYTPEFMQEKIELFESFGKNENVTDEQILQNLSNV
jgi:hypothetical protein